MKHSKSQRITALIGVILLVSLYVLSLVFALIKSPYSLQMFLVSVASTIAIPLMIHFFMMLKNVREGRKLFDNPYTYRDAPKDE